MKNFIKMSAVAAVAIAALSVNAYAESAASDAVKTAPSKNKEIAGKKKIGSEADKASRIEKVLLEKFPKSKFDSVSKSEIEGLYEVRAGKNVFYVEPTARYIVFGNIFDTVSRTDLTQPKRDSASAAASAENKIAIKDLPLSDALKQVKGSGARTLYVFSDPDCPYCKQLESELEKVDNITIYTFMYPLTSLHPQAKSRSVSIWCSDSPQKSWSDYVLRRVEPKEANCGNPVDRNIALASKLGILGTPGMISGDGRIQSGYMEAPRIEQWLDSK